MAKDSGRCTDIDMVQLWPKTGEDVLIYRHGTDMATDTGRCTDIDMVQLWQKTLEDVLI